MRTLWLKAQKKHNNDDVPNIQKVEKASSAIKLGHGIPPELFMVDK